MLPLWLIRIRLMSLYQCIFFGSILQLRSILKWYKKNTQFCYLRIIYSNKITEVKKKYYLNVTFCDKNNKSWIRIHSHLYIYMHTSNSNSPKADRSLPKQSKNKNHYLSKFKIKCVETKYKIWDKKHTTRHKDTDSNSDTHTHTLTNTAAAYRREVIQMWTCLLFCNKDHIWMASLL